MSQIADSILSLAKQASFRSMGESGVILMTDTGQLYSCNETAEVFINQLDGKRATTSILDNICEEFEVEPSELLEDMEKLISYLLSVGVLVQNHSPE